MASRAPSVREAPSAELRELSRQVLQQRYATFLDEPVPALNGRTPRVAAADPALRTALDRLLCEHEYGVTQQVGAGVIDFGRMRREIGLE